jgi:16S rRNA (guanine1207-N2)-methyltransferase
MFLRHRERLLSEAPALWFNPPGDLPWQDFPAPGGCAWQTQDEMARVALAARGLPVALAPVPAGETAFQTVVLAVPREKARLRLLADAVASLLAPGGVCYLAGELRAGGRSAPGQLQEHFGSIQKLDNARHCVLYRLGDPVSTGTFQLADYRQRWQLDCAGQAPLEICSYPGVFADGDLDPGTALLLEQLDSVITRNKGTALDLGCGAGVIGATILRRFPGWTLDMVDSSALAISATRATLEANGLTADVFASDGLKGVEDKTGRLVGPARYDLVISNPPFHAGHRERADLGAGVFEGIRRYLSPRGQVVLVANRHLPWRRWMDDTFGGHTVLATNNAYHVLSSQHR